jgi:hypothetical protein
MFAFPGTARLVVRVVILLLILACGTTDPSSGFTITALVNGSSWAPGGAEPSPPMATLYEGDHTLVLGGTQAGISPRSRGIGIDVRNVTGPGSYPLAAASDGQSSATYTETFGTIGGGDFNLVFYLTSATRTGILDITHLDLTRQTISGSFSFEAATAQGVLVSVTSGAFNGRFASAPGSGH